MCKAVYGWEYPHLFRGTPERLPDLDEILPDSPTWIRRPKSKGFVISRESFKEIFVNSDLTQDETRDKFGISHQALVCAVKEYPEFEQDMLRKRGRLLSASKKAPEPFFAKITLVALSAEGLSLQEMAKRLRVGDSIVEMDLHHHGISRSSGHLLSWLDLLTDGEHEALVALNPAMRELPADFQEAFEVLVETYQRLIGLSDRLKLSGSTLRSLVHSKEVEREHLTFAVNRAEMRLSRALMAVGIRHRRLFCFWKNWQADFAWPDHKLMVEVDGEYHQKCETTKARDKRKTKKAKELVYRVIRVTKEDVERRLPTVMRKIAGALGHELPASFQ
jgi:very-short-patch-repair endonuclease